MALDTPNGRTVVAPHSASSLSVLRVFLERHPGHTRLTASDGATTEIPAEVHDILRQAVDVLVGGCAVSVTPVAAKLTTGQAAEMLGVSRPTLIKMLNDGKIPFEQINVHRTVDLADVVAFRERRRAETRSILDQMTAEATADGLYGETYEDYVDALDDARHHVV